MNWPFTQDMAEKSIQEYLPSFKCSPPENIEIFKNLSHVVPEMGTCEQLGDEHFFETTLVTDYTRYSRKEYSRIYTHL